MLKKLNNINIVLSTGILTSIMFIIVMFIVNPMIDGKNGFEVILLQFSFYKEVGVTIINNWGENGISNFNSYIFTDYLYALLYSIFFASLLTVLIFKAKQENNIRYTWVVQLAFFAGLFDWIENTLELFFINNTIVFSNSLFFIHSIVATLKWLAVPIAIGYVVVLFRKK